MTDGSGHGAGQDRGAPQPLPDPLPLPVVDNHTHVDIARDGGDRPDLTEVIRQARSVGVDRLVQIGCDLAAARWTVETAVTHPAVIGGVALHPNEVPPLAARGDLASAYAEIERLAQHPRVRVVGETGLDYCRTGPEGQGVQHESFRWHIDLAKRLGAGWIVVHAGYHFTSDLVRRKAAALERLQRASEQAEEQDVQLLLENMNPEPADAEVHYLAHDVAECRYFFDQLS